MSTRSTARGARNEHLIKKQNNIVDLIRTQIVSCTRVMDSVGQRYHRLQIEQKDDTSVAQLAEQRSPKPQVGGSTPS